MRIKEVKKGRVGVVTKRESAKKRIQVDFTESGGKKAEWVLEKTMQPSGMLKREIRNNSAVDLGPGHYDVIYPDEWSFQKQLLRADPSFTQHERKNEPLLERSARHGDPGACPSQQDSHADAAVHYDCILTVPYCQEMEGQARIILRAHDPALPMNRVGLLRRLLPFPAQTKITGPQPATWKAAGAWPRMPLCGQWAATRVYPLVASLQRRNGLAKRPSMAGENLRPYVAAAQPGRRSKHMVMSRWSVASEWCLGVPRAAFYGS